MSKIFLGFAENGKKVYYSGNKSMLICCTARWGKFTKLLAWNGLTWPHGLVANDPKGEFSAVVKATREAMGQKFHCINPFGLLPDILGPTARFNPLEKLDYRDPNFTSAISALGSAVIIPDGTDTHWTDSGRILLNGTNAQVTLGPPEHSNLVTAMEVLSLPRDQLLAWMRNAAQSPIDMARYAAAQFIVPDGEDPPKSVWDTLGTVRTQLGSFLSDKNIQHVLTGNDIDWNEVKDGKATVTFALPEAEAKTYFRFTRLLYADMFKHLLQLPAKPVLIDMDELATSLGDKQLDQVETAVSLGPGYGLQLMLVLQSLGQSEAIFGKNKAMAVMASCGVWQFGRPNDPVTAEVISKRSGQHDVVQIARSLNEGGSSTERGHSHSWNVSESISVKTVPLYREQDLYHMPDYKIVTFIDGIGYPIELIGMPYYAPQSNVKHLASPNPYSPGYVPPARVAARPAHLLLPPPRKLT